jgi:putative toxin-antitoxin system antitoxin component (TIGR02293 family)
MARLLGIGEATLRRARARGSPLDATTSDRLYRLSKAIAAAEDVLCGPENARSWLRRPQPGLGGQVPLDLLLTQAGADQVETLLRRIEHGVYT